MIQTIEQCREIADNITALARDVIVDTGRNAQYDINPDVFFVITDVQSDINPIGLGLNGRFSERHRDSWRETVLGHDRRRSFSIATIAVRGFDAYGSCQYQERGLTNLELTTYDLYKAMIGHARDGRGQLSPGSPSDEATRGFLSNLSEINPFWYDRLSQQP